MLAACRGRPGAGEQVGRLLPGGLAVESDRTFGEDEGCSVEEETRTLDGLNTSQLTVLRAVHTQAGTSEHQYRALRAG
jgi:hypothetical protein